MTSPQRITDIVFASDAGFYEGLVAALCSASFHLPADRPVTFHILDGGIETNQREHLEQVISRLGGPGRFRIIPYDASIFRDLPAIRGKSHMTYARLSAPTIIDAELFLYVDCDVLVFKDLGSFPIVPGQEQVCAGLVDPTYGTMASDLAGAGLSADEECMPYLNAGVLAVHRENWIAGDISAKCVEFLRAHPAAQAWDQTAINHVALHRKRVEPAGEWNRNVTRFSNQVILESGLEQVFHYVGGAKPWAPDPAPPESAVGSLIFHRFCRHLFVDAPVPSMPADVSKFGRRVVRKRTEALLSGGLARARRWKDARVNTRQLQAMATRIDDYLEKHIPHQALSWPESV